MAAIAEAISTCPSHVAVSGERDNANALISLQFRNGGGDRQNMIILFKIIGCDILTQIVMFFIAAKRRRIFGVRLNLKNA